MTTGTALFHGLTAFHPSYSFSVCLLIAESALENLFYLTNNQIFILFTPDIF